MFVLLKMGIFHCYVSLPEGTNSTHQMQEIYSHSSTTPSGPSPKRVNEIPQKTVGPRKTTPINGVPEKMAGNKWVTWVMTLLIGVITLLITAFPGPTLHRIPTFLEVGGVGFLLDSGHWSRYLSCC